MQITATQVKDLLDSVDVYILKFLAENVAQEHLTTAEKVLLKKWGIDIKKFSPKTVDQAFKFGMLSEALGDKIAKNMNYEQLKAHLQKKAFLPLDMREKAVLRQLRYQAFYQIKGLGNRVKNDFQTILVEADKAQRTRYEATIRDAAKRTIVNRDNIKQMSSRIGHKTGDWARDLDRISDYVLHDAHDHGRAYQIKRQLGTGALVYKHVFDQACPHCVRLYLTAGRGSQPIIFNISTLQKNSTNIGRKAKDWKPVIGATHPWCRCQLESIPIGSTWDDKEKRFRIQLTDKEKEIKKKIKFKMEA